MNIVSGISSVYHRERKEVATITPKKTKEIAKARLRVTCVDKVGKPVTGEIQVNGVRVGVTSYDGSETPRLVTVYFGDLPNYVTPKVQQVEIIENQVTEVTGIYQPLTQDGVLNIRAEDDDIQFIAFAPILVNGTQVGSGQFQKHYPPGTYLIVEFGDILPNYVKPEPQTATIVAGETLTKVGVYTSRYVELDPKNEAKIASRIQHDCGILANANENGLFSAQDEVTFEECRELLRDAESKLNKGDAFNSTKKCFEASSKIDDAFNAASLRWQIIHLYGIHFLLYLLTALISLVYVSLLYADASFGNILWVPVWSFTLGGVGAVARGLYGLWQAISDRTLRKVWLTWYLIAPFIGMIFGVIVYLAFFAGYVATTQTSVVKGMALPMLLSLLAGFSWEWVVDLLDQLQETFGSRS